MLFTIPYVQLEIRPFAASTTQKMPLIALTGEITQLSNTLSGLAMSVPTSEKYTVAERIMARNETSQIFSNLLQCRKSRLTSSTAVPMSSIVVEKDPTML